MSDTTVLIQYLKTDQNFIKKMSRDYLDLGSFYGVEKKYKLQKGTIEAVFEDEPDIAGEFDRVLEVMARTRLKREGAHKIFVIINSMYGVITNEDDIEEGGATLSDKVRAANVAAKLLEFSHLTKPKKGDKNDLDDLLRQLEEDDKSI